MKAGSDRVVACSSGVANVSIEPADSPSLSRNRADASPSRPSTRSRLSASTCSRTIGSPVAAFNASRPIT